MDTYGWLTSTQFADIYALGQVVPGPDELVIGIGYKAAGILGALVALFADRSRSGRGAWRGPDRWDRLGKWRWHDAIQRGLTPVTSGLLLAASCTAALDNPRRPSGRHRRGRCPAAAHAPRQPKHSCADGGRCWSRPLPLTDSKTPSPSADNPVGFRLLD